MSTWGSWGYWGIVAGLVTMVSVFIVCIVFLSPSPRGTATGETKSAGDRPDRAAAGSKHAA